MCRAFALRGTMQQSNGSAMDGVLQAARPRRALIATPVHDHKTHAIYTHAYGETIRLGCQIGVDIRGLFWPGEALIQTARNELVRAALEHEFDDLVFIDSDQAWKPEWVVGLLRHPVDCVGGAVAKKAEREAYNVRSTVVPLPRCPKTGLLEVDGVGTGFLRLSRAAMTALWHLSEEYRDDFGKVHRWMFDVRPIDGRLVSEDMGMCRKLAAAGIKTYVDPSITCEHAGNNVWKGDFAAWLARIEAAKSEDTVENHNAQVAAKH